MARGVESTDGLLISPRSGRADKVSGEAGAVLTSEGFSLSVLTRRLAKPERHADKRSPRRGRSVLKC
jgi:hypothetical protein